MFRVFLAVFLLAACFRPYPTYSQVPQASVKDKADKIPTGLIFLDKRVYESIPKASSPMMGELPPRKDLTSQFPIPGDQGVDQNSCAAWAVAYAMKTYQEASARHWSIATDDHIFSPAFLYNQLNLTPDCLGGLSFLDVLNFVHSSGVSSMKDFPYDPKSCSTKPSQMIKKSAADFKIGSYRQVNLQDPTEVKSQLTAGNPVLVGMYIDDFFWRSYRGDKGKTVYNRFMASDKKGQHAVVLLGFDEDKRAYKLINSWGLGWGDGGYGWIAYDTLKEMAEEGFVIQSDPTNIYTIASSTTNPIQASPNQPNLQVGQPVLQNNVLVRNPAGLFYPGVTITVPGQLTGAVGRHLQLVARFIFPNGQMATAEYREFAYRDATGLVAVGTPDLPITAPSVSLDQFSFSIPYYAIARQAPPGIAPTYYQVSVVISAYVNSFLVYETVPETFSFVE